MTAYVEERLGAVREEKAFWCDALGDRSGKSDTLDHIRESEQTRGIVNTPVSLSALNLKKRILKMPGWYLKYFAYSQLSLVPG